MSQKEMEKAMEAVLKRRREKRRVRNNGSL
jgi:hypothetical protein